LKKNFRFLLLFITSISKFIVDFGKAENERMKSKWRKYTSVFLASVFLILSFTVEFAHQHSSSQTSLLLKHECECEISADEKNSVQTGNNLCFSCVYSKTTVVLNSCVQPSQIFVSNQILQLAEEQALLSYIGSLFNNRAPPQAIS